jgi:type I restriction enzyme S subunit
LTADELGLAVATREEKLPENWTRARLDRVGAVRLGRQRSPDKQSGRHTTKYLRAGNITPAGLDLTNVLEMDFTPAERAIFTLKDGDLVVTEASGSAAQVGRAAIWRDEIPGCCFQNTVIRLRPHAVTSEFALLTLRHLALSGEFERVARGVGIQHLGASRFASIEVAVPPLAAQARIAKVADDKLKELREAEAALQSALGGIAAQDKEILAAAATGELVEPEAILAARAGRPYISGREALAAARVASTEPEAPEPTAVEEGGPPGWARTTIGRAGEVVLGKMREPSRHKGPNMRPYLRVANVFEARIDVSDVHEMHFSNAEAETYLLRRGDILLNEGQSPELVGRPAMFNDEIAGTCFQNTLLRFRAGPAVDRDFALLVFRHYLHAGEFKKVARWSTNIAHLTKKRFSALPFPVPPMEEQKRIVAEAHGRLEASAAQRTLVETSLARIPGMIAQLLGAAVNGAFATQDPTDEPATALLKRLGPPPKDVLPLPPTPETDELGTVVDTATDDADTSALTLADVLRASGRPMTPPDLCYAAGYDRNQVGEVERFYVTMRRELGTTVRIAEPAEENALVEVIDAA